MFIALTPVSPVRPMSNHDQGPEMSLQGRIDEKYDSLMSPK